MSIATQQNIFENKALDSEKFDKSFPKGRTSNQGLASSYDVAHPYHVVTRDRENSNLNKIGKYLYGKIWAFGSDPKGGFVKKVIDDNSSGIVVHGNLYKTDIAGFQAKVNEMLADVNTKK